MMFPKAERPMIPKLKEVGPLDPASRVPKMPKTEAVAQAEKMVPKEKAAEYGKYRDGVKANVEKIKEKLTPEEVGNLQRDPGTVREVLGKGGKDAVPVSPEAKSTFQKGRREVYDAADRPTIDNLKQRPEYSDGKIKVREVSTSGEADAAVRSTDRDHMYVIERTVKGPDGKMVTVEEPIPVEKWGKDYNKHYAEATRYDPLEPLPGYTDKQWRRMTLDERFAANAEQSGQNPMGRTSKEFFVEKRLDKGPGKLTSDPEWTGKAETDKFRSQWNKGDVGSRGESLKQLDKAGEAAREAASQSGRALDQQTLDALDIVKQGGDPAVVDQAVRNLGVNGGVEGLGNRLDSIIEWNKFSPK